MSLLLEAQYRCHESHSFLTAKLACTVTASASAALPDIHIKFHSAAQLSKTLFNEGKTTLLANQLPN